MRAFDHTKIEKKWQKAWAKKGLYKTSDKAKGKDNFYLLVEFPYPSGNLHVGHWYAFAVPDIFARYQRMLGKNVMYPIGFDAFGLPAENAAIKNNLNPRVWTEKNIAYMKKQIESMGTSFDWSREVRTIDPGYYQWTQWLFLQFFKNGLAYQKDTPVNWCPKDKTVLANEQVVDGKCERCGSEVVQRSMLQWNLKITDYADRLIDDLAPLDWPEQIKESQRNWIGRSEGYEIDFPLAGIDTVKRIVILHGKNGSSEDAFYPWLKAKLEKRGYEVLVPQLPNPDEPNDEEQTDFVQKNCIFDEQTAIVGHSFGGVVALRLLERGVKVQRVTLVATPISGKFLDDKKRPTVTAACKKGFDWKKIKQQAKAFIVLPDIHDPVVPLSDAQLLERELGGMLLVGRGVEGHFQAKREPDVLLASSPMLRVFTTSPDTLFGGTFLVLAPEHPWLTLALKNGVLKNTDEVTKHVEQARKKTELERQTDQKDKTGVELKGVKAINPTTGAEMPLWVADYALMGFGTGALFGDAHDARDVAFAKKYNIPLKETLEPLFVQRVGADASRPGETLVHRDSILAFVKHWSEDKYLGIHYRPTNINECVSGGIDKGEDPVAAAKREIREETGYTNARFVRNLGGKLHTKYFSLKYGNLFVHFTPMLFKLEDGAQEQIAPHELEQHDVSWFTKKEMDAFLNRDDMRTVWKRIQDESPFEGKGILFDSGEFSGLTSDEAIPKVGEKFGRMVRQYRLRDWIVSRQRYWGVPIPVIHCPNCGAIAVPDKDLPVKLPEVKDYLPEGSGKSPLAKVAKFVNVKCPKCKGNARRETDTLDTFVDSSWYFLRYADPKNKKKFADPKRIADWMPIDLYSGGAEHTTMHVLYSRFWQKAMYDLDLVKDSEPYLRRMNHSVILGPDGQKMSKSHGNVVDPDEVVARLGSDTVRMYLAFIGPYNEVASYPWNPNGVVGVRRFLERICRASAFIQKEEVAEIEGNLHRTIKKVGEDIQALKFNTAISQLMILLNEIEKKKKIGGAQWRSFLKLLAPFAPFLAEELWYDTGHKSSIHLEQWPAFDAERAQADTVTIAVQVNGKTRAQIQLRAGVDQVAQEKAAKDAVSSRLAGKKLLRAIVVPGRLVNFVVEE